MGAKLPDIQTIIKAGIDPKTHLPIRMANSKPENRKDSVRSFLRVVDEQDAINRFTWHNLPCNVSGQEIERMLYYKGEICLFFLYGGATAGFYFAPFAKVEGLDLLGRMKAVRPVPMSSGSDEKEQKTVNKFGGIELEVLYDLPDHEMDASELRGHAVVLRDYMYQLSDTTLSRQILNEPLLDAMANCIPLMETSLFLGTGVKGMRVADADQQENVRIASNSMRQAALTQQAYVPIIGTIEFQDLSNGSPAQGQDFMLAMQSIDNLRLAGYGLENGGLFEKKAHELQSEQEINGGPTNLVMEDSLKLRRRFCNIANAAWGLSIWVEENKPTQPQQASMPFQEEGNNNKPMKGKQGGQSND